jgi:hypothetical protein
VATTAGEVASSGEDNAASDGMIENNEALAEMLGLTGTQGIIGMLAENATAQNTMVIPGVVSGEVVRRLSPVQKRDKKSRLTGAPGRPNYYITE